MLMDRQEFRDMEGLYAMTFSTNGERLFVGGRDGVHVWQMEDGRRTAMMATSSVVLCLAVSKDGRYLAGGASWGDVIVWGAETQEEVIKQKQDDKGINGVDFSPDSTQLVWASDNGTATVWDLETNKQVQIIRHSHHDWVRVAKYSPEGNRIVTATHDSIRIHDSSNFRLLVDINTRVSPWRNPSLLYCIDHLFVISGSNIIQLEATSGSLVSEWPVPGVSGSYSCIAQPKHGGCIAYSTDHTVSFWGTSTHTQFSLIQHPEEIRSISVSPDDQFLAIGGRDGNIVIKSISHIIVSTV